jgi:glycosyltransferase involved in cell wall biosynthesis
MKVSVAIITLNEENNIARCLEAAFKVSEDIVVLDSNSSDNTRIIASNMGAKVFVKDFKDFATQKNDAIKETTNDWVLSLDADEVLSETLIESIKNINIEDNNTVFAVKRLTNYCGKWIKFCGWYPDKKIRLWNKSFVKWEGSVHEQALVPNGYKKITLKGDLFHYSYTSIDDHIKQADKFSRLNAEKMFANKVKTNLFNLYFAPCFKFMKIYVFNLGVLDGYYGYVISKISSHATFLKHLRLLELVKA